jgi:hypothetical protein
MNHNLKDNERDLIKQVNYFKRQAEKLISKGNIGEEHAALIASCEKLVDTLMLHATKREEVILQRNAIKTMLKDNARCPKCDTTSHLKPAGIDTSDNGWKCNKYRCRKCNIEFVWAKPNNPWDLIPYLERTLGKFEQLQKEGKSSEESEKMMADIRESISKLRPVIAASDLDWKELEERDAEMTRIVNEFKMHLQIERIKMEAREN